MPYTALPLAPSTTSGAAFAISSDGTVVGGECNNVGCFWTNGTGPTVLTGTAAVYGCSSNGSILTGNSNTTPFRWTSAGGVVLFGTSNDTVFAASSDGSTAVGSTTDAGSTHGQACYWNAAGTRTLLGYLPGHDTSRAMGASSNGAVIVGFSTLSTDGTGNSMRAFRWTSGGGMVNLGLVGAQTFSRAFGCSADGNTVVGAGSSSAFTWTAAGGMVAISGVTVGTGISGDAGTIVGSCPVSGEGSSYFGYWTAAGGVVTPLPNPTDPGATNGTYPYAINGNGTHMVGYSFVNTLPWLYVIGAPSGQTQLGNADLFFNAGGSFMDLSQGQNRRLFSTAIGVPQWLGGNGRLPLNAAPTAYLQAFPSNAAAFAANTDGVGGAFAISGGTLGLTTKNPGCSDYNILIPSPQGSDPQWRLFMSDDGGRTWLLLVKQRSLGKIGAYLQRVRWLKLGQSRQRLLRLECTDPVRKNIVGIYLDTTTGMT